MKPNHSETSPMKGKNPDPIKKDSKLSKAELKKLKRKKKLISLGAIVGVVLLLIVALIIGIDAYMEDKIGMINIQTDENGNYATEPLTEIILPESLDLPDNHGMLDQNDLPLICDTKNVTNILLMATDSRGSDAGLSDSMILLSINKENKKIVLCSFLRDLLVKFPEEPKSTVSGKYDKLTHAHSYGGPQLTMAVLKENYNIEVSYYAKVNFNSFVKVVDAMGGISLYLTSDEIWWINEFLQAEEIQEIFPSYNKKGISGGEGVYRLNGLQALGHARNRRIGSDWARTERQRTILMQLASQAKTLSLTQINNLLETVLPLITTNMPADMIKDMAWDALSYLTYDMESTRVPLAGTYTEVSYNIIPDAKANISDLYEKIYGTPAPETEKQSNSAKSKK